MFAAAGVSGLLCLGCRRASGIAKGRKGRPPSKANRTYRQYLLDGDPILEQIRKEGRAATIAAKAGGAPFGLMRPKKKMCRSPKAIAGIGCLP